MWSWLINPLVDRGWVWPLRFLNYCFGPETALAPLFEDAVLEKIKSRFQLLKENGFFSGQDGQNNARVLIQALFAYNKDGKQFNERYEFLKQSQFLEHTKEGVHNNQALIRALFAYDENKTSFFYTILHSSSWLHRGSVEPLKSFFKFIKTIFQKASTENASLYKETFIQAVFNQDKGEDSALSQAAAVQNPVSPLGLLVEILAQAGCFETSEGKQRFINAVFAQNKSGENAIAKTHALWGFALEQKTNPNLTALFDALFDKANFLTEPTAEANKKAFIHAVLAPAQGGSALYAAMFQLSSLKCILKALEQVGCFTDEDSKQVFINAVLTPNTPRHNPVLQMVRFSFDSDRSNVFTLVFDKLMMAGCFQGPRAEANKKAFINAVFAQEEDSQSALSKAAFSGGTFPLKTLLGKLALAGCFDGPPGSSSQQVFIKAVLTKDKWGKCALEFPSSCRLLLEQLKKMQWFVGSHGEANKQAFIQAALTLNEDGVSLLSSSPNDRFYAPLPLLLEQLTAAGCFEGPLGSPSKKAFITAVFAQDSKRRNLLSRARCPGYLALILEKLAEAGCFDTATDRANFIKAVRAAGNECLFNAVFDRKNYIALRESLLRAGYSTEDFSKLLNQEVTQFSYDEYRPSPLTPLMDALYCDEHNSRFWAIDRLKKDGAKLTPEQQQRVDQAKERVALRCAQDKQERQRELEREAKFDKEKIIAKTKANLKPQTVANILQYQKPKLTSSLRGLTLFTTGKEWSDQHRGQKPPLGHTIPRRGSWSGALTQPPTHTPPAPVESKGLHR